jgi:hypothetical protein
MSATTIKPVAVFFDGPQSDFNRDGDEIPMWVVYAGDDDANPIGKVYHFHNFAGAQALARKMARERRLELVDEASRD